MTVSTLSITADTKSDARSGPTEKTDSSAVVEWVNDEPSLSLSDLSVLGF